MMPRKFQNIVRNRDTDYRALLRKMTHDDKAPYYSTPPCMQYIYVMHICTVFLTKELTFEMVYQVQRARIKARVLGTNSRVTSMYIDYTCVFPPFLTVQRARNEARSRRYLSQFLKGIAVSASGTGRQIRKQHCSSAPPSCCTPHSCTTTPRPSKTGSCFDQTEWHATIIATGTCFFFTKKHACC